MSTKGPLIYKKLRGYSLVFIALICLAGLGLSQGLSSTSEASSTKLTPPATGKIRVAFVLVGGGEFVDFAGPWSVFHQVLSPKGGTTMDELEAFQLYVVSNSTKPIRSTGGMQIIPDYTFADAPQPNVVVVPGTGKTPEMLDWIRNMTKQSDVVMSVCVGGYILAAAGVLEGKKAATFGFMDAMKKYPDIHFIPNMRYVQSDPVIFTSGPTGAGIDLALHIVELYFGRKVAQDTAFGLNYQGLGWMGDGTDAIKKPLPSDEFTAGVPGNWKGKVVTKDGPLQLALHIWPDEKKQLVGYAEILNRDSESIFVDPISFKDPDLHFEMHTISSVYDGKINAKGDSIKGIWTLGGASTKLVLTRVAK